MKIVFLDQATLGDDIDLSAFATLGELKVFATTAQSEVVERLKGAQVAIINKVKLSKDVLEQLPDLKLIAVAATGTDNIDKVTADNLGISVKNVAGYSTASVVQHTFSLLFYLLEDLPYYQQFTSSHHWQESTIFTHFKSFSELANMRIGIIGLGIIGQEVAKVSKAFGAQICYYSTSGTNRNSDYTRVELEELLKTCDVITIHAPLNDKTIHLLNIKNLTLLKENAILLNLGRGGIINEQDLVEVLKTKKIKVGLDVLASEPPMLNDPVNKLVDYPGVIITPHIAWASLESRKRLVEKVFQNVQSFMGKNNH